jgi:hypothetical protein
VNVGSPRPALPGPHRHAPDYGRGGGCRGQHGATARARRLDEPAHGRLRLSRLTACGLPAPACPPR